MPESNFDKVRRLRFEEASRLTIGQRKREGMSAYPELNIGLFFDGRNEKAMQPGRCKPFEGSDLMSLLTEEAVLDDPVML